MARGCGRFFCTAGRGLEPFLAREVRARLGATQVDCVSGKVFFSTEAEPGELRRLKSGERLFLLLKRHPPLAVSRDRGRMLHEMKSLVLEEPESWLDVLSVWRKLHGGKGQKDGVCEESQLPLKRRAEEETNGATKRLKAEQETEVVSEEGHAKAGEKQVAAESSGGEECWAEGKMCSEKPPQGSEEQPAGREQPSFRVSCRCSGAIAKVLPSQELGRALGIALMKQFGWRVDLRDPELEVFVHLNDIHTVVGIPLFRLSLASREYIRTAGLRSTIAWAMASLADISAGACVLDPMCGLGTILLEAATEWPSQSALFKLHSISSCLSKPLSEVPPQLCCSPIGYWKAALRCPWRFLKILSVLSGPGPERSEDSTTLAPFLCPLHVAGCDGWRSPSSGFLCAAGQL
ncbi:THUMP domain-containing protein 2 isoform X2 [Pogoniulus pusillus]|uniref:THUMP domain-containing protein 2 isoform X2 n=1 Tax=Pogoniulus pusillus TaxID=488313 RepID=UPI0030B9AACE